MLKPSTVVRLQDNRGIGFAQFWFESDSYWGHCGTRNAICGIILHHCPNAELFVIKLFDQNQNHVQDEALIRVLQYIEQNVPCDIINLSLGINMCNHKKQLYDLCRKLDQRGSILISAFDNWESLSYPAAFDVVIGVSSGEEIYTSSELDFIDNSVVKLPGLRKISTSVLEGTLLPVFRRE